MTLAETTSTLLDATRQTLGLRRLSSAEVADQIRAVDDESAPVKVAIADAALDELEGVEGAAARKRDAEKTLARLTSRREGLAQALEGAQAREQRAAADEAARAEAEAAIERRRLARAVAAANADRTEKIRAFCADAAKLAESWQGVADSQTELYTGLIAFAPLELDQKLDFDGALLRIDLLRVGALQELKRQGADFAGAIREKHTVAPFVDVAEASDAYIARRISEISGLSL